MRQLVQYSNGERRVIDLETMTASEFLASGDCAAPLSEYALDLELDGRDLDPNNTGFSIIRSDAK